MLLETTTHTSVKKLPLSRRPLLSPNHCARKRRRVRRQSDGRKEKLQKFLQSYWCKQSWKVTLHASKMCGRSGENEDEKERGGFTVFSAMMQGWMKVWIWGHMIKGGPAGLSFSSVAHRLIDMSSGRGQNGSKPTFPVWLNGLRSLNSIPLTPKKKQNSSSFLGFVFWFFYSSE